MLSRHYFRLVNASMQQHSSNLYNL